MGSDERRDLRGGREGGGGGRQHYLRGSMELGGGEPALLLIAQTQRVSPAKLKEGELRRTKRSGRR